MAEPVENPTPAAAPPADPPPASSKCPECAAEFDGLSVTHASETLAMLREENSTLKTELAAEKAKEPAPIAPPALLPKAAAKKRGLLYRKSAA